MEKKQPIHLSTVESPLVPIGTVMGQRVYIELRGHTAEERDRSFVQIKAMIASLFEPPKKKERRDDGTGSDMWPEVPNA